jgi:hypothetical protein
VAAFVFPDFFQMKNVTSGKELYDVSKLRKNEIVCSAKAKTRACPKSVFALSALRGGRAVEGHNKASQRLEKTRAQAQPK